MEAVTTRANSTLSWRWQVGDDSRNARELLAYPKNLAEWFAQMSNGTTSLVTGAAGFIGSHVVDELLARGHAVVALDDLSGGSESSLNPSARFVRGSILDEPLVVRLFQEWKFDYVFHLAAYAAEGLSHFIRRYNS